MTLPLHLQMEIDIHAQLHQKEIAGGFAKLRAKLPPDPTLDMARLQQALSNAAFVAVSFDQMQALRPANPFLPSQWDAQRSHPYVGGGLFGNVLGTAHNPCATPW